jgi:hypothetical protein
MKFIKILSGSLTFFSGSMTPVSFMKHPNYNSASLDYDLALVTLSDDVSLTASRGPVCLPDESTLDNR